MKKDTTYPIIGLILCCFVAYQICDCAGRESESKAFAKFADSAKAEAFLKAGYRPIYHWYSSEPEWVKP